MALIADSNGRSHTPATVVAGETPLNRRDSQSRASNRSSLWYSRGTFQQIPQDPENLENSRASMKPLAECLMTKYPPPNNCISILSDDEKSLLFVTKSVFNFFGRRKSKKQKATQFLQLPNTAVAAKTRSGARHIAISIPSEHDHIEKPKVPPAPPTSLLQPSLQRNPSTNRPDRSAVTGLKPFAELRESGSSNLSSAPKSRKSATELSHVRQDPLTISPVEALGLDTTQTFRDCYTGLEEEQKGSGVEFSPAKLDLARAKSYVAVFPTILHQDSQRSDPRSSGGTEYSTLSLGTFQGHSRGRSSISTTPSATMISPLKMTLPTREFGMSKVPTDIKAELAKPSNLVSEVFQDEPLSTARSRASETTASQIASTPSSPLAFSTAKAEIMRSFSGSGEGGAQIVRRLTPRSQGPSPVLSKNLPDQLPFTQNAISSRPKNAPPVHARPTAVALLKEDETRHARDGKDDALRMTRQSRQDRVKARKLRDIESLRSKPESRDPLVEAVLPPNLAPEALSKTLTITKISTPSRNPKRRSISQELARRKAAISITPIMVVADLAPSTSVVLKSELPLTTLGKFTTSNPPKSSTIRSAENAPPHPLNSLSDSDQLLLQSPRSLRPRAGSARCKLLSPTGGMLESRRRERRMKRNLRERKKVLDDRLGTIERDNKLLIGTLSGIASSFEELSRSV